MTKESLDSDRVNYMIWRYLIDSGACTTHLISTGDVVLPSPFSILTAISSGYQETAVRLQKEWNVQDPQSLSCAPHVPNHALVVLLNRGLVYTAIDRELAEVTAEGDAVAVTGFFGPLTPTSSTSAAPADDEDFENVRKRQIDNEQPAMSNGPPPKRPRLSNGYENGFDANAMEVDEEQNGDEHAYPSPEQLPSPVVATVGPEQGTQIDKVNELSTETVFLELSDDQASRNAVLLQCEWNPRDPKILAAAGTDALARMWTLERTAADSEPDAQGGKPQFQPHHSLLPGSASPTTTVTGLAWSSDGASLAVSSEPVDDGTAKIDFWTVEGSPFASFNTFESPIICLRWNPSNTACLSISPDKGGTETVVTIMSPTNDEAIKYILPQHNLHEQVLDAVWTSNEEFVISGGDLLQGLHCVESVISPSRKFETREGHSIAKITYDWRSELLATASETGTIDIWDPTGRCQSFDAHQGNITALAWQPLPFPVAVGEESERLLVSSGEDGAISMWNARSTDSKPRSMTMGSAVVSLAFTPDGAFLAAGTTDRIFIWKVDDPVAPKASWLRSDQSGWRTPMSQDSAGDENQYSLSWDAHGQKLAYGAGNSLAIINFRR
ncbi:Putative isomerase YbhE [Glarea lozoyensis ATCC 20868]|uniref:Putative isomerase YbhE n=1 Tax=Glarea lozoyensis (strain ATCC 20868 / MF5171) TaxID=1116229 RepID=S3DWA5_GLAL2|nr:Putative isomerase YbhE [Glarea lozoyensis ATCC 20868]EPE30668.1 Putative isomerase YbhE [Glarea lozoyensis ATCC 20868]